MTLDGGQMVFSNKSAGGVGELGRMIEEIPTDSGDWYIFFGALTLITFAVGLGWKGNEMIGTGRLDGLYFMFGIAVLSGVALVYGVILREKTKRTWANLMRFCECIEVERVAQALWEVDYSDEGIELARRLWLIEGRENFGSVWLAGVSPFRDKREFWKKVRVLEGVSGLAEAVEVTRRREINTLSLRQRLPLIAFWGVSAVTEAKSKGIPKFWICIWALLIVVTIAAIVTGILRKLSKRTMPEDREIRSFLGRLTNVELRLLIEDWRLGRLAQVEIDSRKAVNETLENIVE
jgi:hypothetical protein